MRLASTLASALILAAFSIGVAQDPKPAQEPKPTQEPKPAQEVKVERLEKLETAIPEGIRLLEAKEYTLFMKSFAKPDDLKRVLEKESMDEFAKRFGETRGAILLSILKDFKDVKPKMDETGTKATYPVKTEGSPKKEMTFTKIEKRWYIEN